MNDFDFSVCITKLANGTNFHLLFPGYKADIENGRWDYRVDIEKGGRRLPLSHANIITDIYNKCHRRPDLVEEIKTFIINLPREGKTDPLTDCPNLRIYTNVEPPSAELLDIVSQAHRQLRKTFSRAGNSWDLTIDELTNAIIWIAIQEDINYPFFRAEGRLMPFKRYYEAIICQEHGHSISEVIQRALNERYRPVNWEGIDYLVLKK